MAVALGSTLAALLVCIPNMRQMNVVSVLGIAVTFMLIGSLPALFAGLPALRVLRRLNFEGLPAALVMAVGGGAVGAALMIPVSSTFLSAGALAGGSIGLMQVVLLHNTSRAVG